MLILSRKKEQGFRIGDIHVKILDVERDRVKVGISAPGGITILRDELFGGESEEKFRRKTELENFQSEDTS